jgi:hypothetical protein
MRDARTIKRGYEELKDGDTGEWLNGFGNEPFGC